MRATCRPRARHGLPERGRPGDRRGRSHPRQPLPGTREAWPQRVGWLMTGNRSSASASAARFGLRLATPASDVLCPDLHGLAPPLQQVRAGVRGLGLTADLVCERCPRHLTRRARLRAPVAKRRSHTVRRPPDAESPEQLAEHRGVDPSSLRAPGHDLALVVALPGFLKDLQRPPRQGTPVLQDGTNQHKSELAIKYSARW